MTALVTYTLSEIPLELKRMLAVMELGGEPTYHPLAQAAADVRRPYCEPASPDMITAWAHAFAAMKPSKAPKERTKEWEGWIGGLILAGEDLPAACWSKSALKTAIRSFTFWPEQDELFKKVLEPIAKAIRAEVDSLDRIARAPKFFQHARESSEPYHAGPLPDWLTKEPSKLNRDPAEGEPVVIDQSVVDAQLAALGHPRGTPLEPRTLGHIYDANGLPNPREPLKRVANDG